MAPDCGVAHRHLDDLDLVRHDHDLVRKSYGTEKQESRKE